MTIAQVKLGRSKGTLLSFIRAFPIHISVRFDPNSYGISKTILGLSFLQLKGQKIFFSKPFLTP